MDKCHVESACNLKRKGYLRNFIFTHFLFKGNSDKSLPFPSGRSFWRKKAKLQGILLYDTPVWIAVLCNCALFVVNHELCRTTAGRKNTEQILCRHFALRDKLANSHFFSNPSHKKEPIKCYAGLVHCNIH